MTLFQHLRVKKQPDPVVVASGTLSAEQLARDASEPLTLGQILNLPENLQRRLFRAALAPELLGRFSIDPITWRARGGATGVTLIGDPDGGSVHIAAHTTQAPDDPFLLLEFADNSLNGIDLHLLILNDPEAPRYQIDRDAEGHSTFLGSTRRNLDEEVRAMQAGLAPGQVRASLGASRVVLDHFETMLSGLGHRAYYLEPLTYVSAWVFERRGFAYVRGHKLMDDIQREFQPGGCLHAALDGSTPFRQPDQWRTVRGRAWAIHDGILEAIGERWEGLRMVKQIGRQAAVDTFPEAVY